MEERKTAITRTRKIEGFLITLTHVTKSPTMGWAVPMKWTLDVEGVTPQEILAAASEHFKIMIRAKFGLKKMAESEVIEKFSERTFKIAEVLKMQAEKSAKVSLSEDDKRVMALVKKYMGEGVKFTEAYRKAIDEIELEDMETGEDAGETN